MGERLRTGGARPRVAAPLVSPRLAPSPPSPARATGLGAAGGAGSLSSPAQGEPGGRSELPLPGFTASPPPRLAQPTILSPALPPTSPPGVASRAGAHRPARTASRRGALRARAAEAERGVAVRSPQRCRGERRRPRRWGSSGAAPGPRLRLQLPACGERPR